MTYTAAQALADGPGIFLAAGLPDMPFRIRFGTANDTWGVDPDGMPVVYFISEQDPSFTKQLLAHELCHICQHYFLGLISPYSSQGVEAFEPKWRGYIDIRWRAGDRVPVHGRPCVQYAFDQATAYGCRVTEDMAITFAWIAGAQQTSIPGMFGDQQEVDELKTYFRETFGGEDMAATIEFSMDLVNGNATRIGAGPNGAFSLTEIERASLGLVTGRSYSAQMTRIWLAGTEATFPDVLGRVYEDTAVPIGQTGRWKFYAAARRDVGGSGRYELAITPVTAKVVR